MLKSLFSGVSGLQSHQVAMDIEANNIANVNTTGYKYSRANFSDLLAQTRAIATAPQGSLGGKNPVQVGLGSTISSMTRIFSQGSVQNSDKNTDVAIQGDGFYIISPDGGNTYKYTRAGDFKFDAGGNFVDNNGFVVQGWLRDPATGNVDSTAPITSINIPPGLTTPASATTEVVVKANLNSGPLIESFSPAYEVPYGTPPILPIPPALDDNGNAISSGDIGVMFNETGEAFSLQKDQGIWASFLNSQVTGAGVIPASTVDTTPVAAVVGGFTTELNITIDGVNIVTTGGAGTLTADENGARYVSQINAALAAASKTGITAAYNTTTDEITISSAKNLAVTITVADDGDSALANDILAAQTNELNLEFTLDNGTTQTITTSNATGTESAIENGARYVSAINAQTATTGVSASYDTITGTITLVNSNGNPAASHNIRLAQLAGDNSGIATQTNTTAYRYQYDPVASFKGLNLDKTFTTLADLREAMELQARDPDGNGIYTDNNIQISINASGKFEILNPGGNTNEYNTNLAITGMSAASVAGGGITENTRFTRNMEALNSALPQGGTGQAFSQSFNAATHSSSIDLFDSLGSKHTLRVEFRKTSVDTATGSTWSMLVSVPSPATIDTTVPFNEKAGTIRFNNDGSLATYNPPNISFTGNNGSAANLQVGINLGTANAFDGMTSFDSVSATSGISQDGFTGGDLVGIRIDQSGTLVGSFSNGRSFGLAQIGMAKFTNNEGLSTEGGNVYIQTANSGDPIIGTAATAGRGFIQSSALEASNVDLSRALTQLIIVQRGFQANGKTITTSDQLLQTLIGLKQ
ncbi:MAG: flagellar hook-basal body complex protein [Sulfurimonas sp.]|nr:flagellar hook-basal body complex protein [Sulfurimonas sp.]